MVPLQVVQGQTDPLLVDRQPRLNIVQFILENGEMLEADAGVFREHSSVLKDIYIDRGIHEIDVSEFPADIVILFVGAMGTGSIEVTRGNFRDLHKLCHVFNVEWMLIKCTEFDQEQFETAEAFKDITFLFEESVYLCQARLADPVAFSRCGYQMLREKRKKNVTRMSGITWITPPIYPSTPWSSYYY